MKPTIMLHNGKPGMPVIVLIHGLGMNNYFWSDPEKCHVLGGLAPLTIFLADAVNKPQNTISFGSVSPHLHGLWNKLGTEGFSLASWSQSQPLGPIAIAIAELQAALDSVREKWPGRTIYLVGHSRGGLIARRFLLEQKATDIDGLITICSPHSGTEMARYSRYLKPVGSLLEKIIPAQAQAILTKALSRLAIFLQSPAIEELTPGSDFMLAMQKPLPGRIAKLSFGGTSPALFQVIVRLPGGGQKVIRFPDLLAGIIPSDHLPRELTPGHGDALVAAESAKLSGGKHYNFPDNHVKAAYDDLIHTKILEFLNR